MKKKVLIIFSIFFFVILSIYLIPLSKIKALWYNKKAMDLYYANFADFYYDSLMYSQIIGYLNKARLSDSTYYMSYKNLAMVYADKDEYEKAINIMKIMERMKPDDFEVKIYIVEQYGKMGFTDSVRYYSDRIFSALDQKIAVAKNDEIRIEIEFYKALVFHEIGDKDSAVNMMKKIILENPDHSNIENYKDFYELFDKSP